MAAASTCGWFGWAILYHRGERGQIQNGSKSGAARCKASLSPDTAPAKVRDFRNEERRTWEDRRCPEANLEPELRTNAGTQVVMGSIVEVNVIANFQADANGAGKSLDTAPRI